MKKDLAATPARTDKLAEAINKSCGWNEKDFARFCSPTAGASWSIIQGYACVRSVLSADTAHTDKFDEEIKLMGL